MGHDDELADVNLDGVPLVTDNYRAWLVPAEASGFESVYDWWEYLHKRDLLLPPNAAAYVKELVDVCPTSRWRADGTRKRGNRSRALLLAEKLLELGFTIAQLEELTNLTGDQMLGADMHGAWNMIANGATVSQARDRYPNLRMWDLKRFYKIVNGEPVARDHPVEWRQELFDLMDQGMGVTEAARALGERHGVEIKYNTAYAWVKRYRTVQEVAS